MKKIFLITLAITCCALLQAQEYIPYGVEGTMPSSFEKMEETLSYPLSWQQSKTKDFNKWKSLAQKKVMECLAPAPPEKTYEMKVLQREQRAGYEVRKIAFNISKFDRIPAYMLVPTKGKGPYPAIILLHDHGAEFTIGKEKLVRPLKTEENRMLVSYNRKRLDVKGKPTKEEKRLIDVSDRWVKACYDGVYIGDYFASKGYVVFAMDALFWGERGRKEGADYNVQESLACNLQQLGYSWCGIITHNDITSASFVAAQPEVDARRIGTLGFSMGAHRAWMLSATSHLIKAGAAICWMNTTDSLMTLNNNQNKGGSAWSMLIPGIRNYLDYPDVASLACPKPMLFFNGLQDKLFPVGGVKKAYAKMHEVWKSQKSDDKLITKFWDSPHFFSKPMQEEVLQFFNKNL